EAVVIYRHRTCPHIRIPISIAARVHFCPRTKVITLRWSKCKCGSSRKATASSSEAVEQEIRFKQHNSSKQMQAVRLTEADASSTTLGSR
uniref:Uncharacterized protein n=1 Tax=Anopheles atroparvus TaxID=41427 RepID=A0AAG5DQ04_ANOAO